ncbi:MAG: hypothetical protein IJN54_00410 [Lachnospiraceae bacterium]|nr:hypothetical protein [Lachnospiraceae bacterium]
MSMMIGNNIGISGSYQSNSSKTGGYKSVREYSYTFKGADLKSVTDSFIAKMSSLSTTMSSMSGFDMKI